MSQVSRDYPTQLVGDGIIAVAVLTILIVALAPILHQSVYKSYDVVVQDIDQNVLGQQILRIEPSHSLPNQVIFEVEQAGIVHPPPLKVLVTLSCTPIKDSDTFVCRFPNRSQLTLTSR